jgi:hypothetical protein
MDEVKIPSKFFRNVGRLAHRLGFGFDQIEAKLPETLRKSPFQVLDASFPLLDKQTPVGEDVAHSIHVVVAIHSIYNCL